MINDALFKNVVNLDINLMKYVRGQLKKVYIPRVKDVIMDSYDKLLVGPVIDTRSKTNPLYYRNEFKTALDSFNFLKETDTTTTFVMPDLQNFPFNIGRLKIIKTILEGIVGLYVEVTEDQYIKLFGKKVNLPEPYDKSVLPKDRIYLVRYTNDVQRREYQVFKRPTLIRYPFSNSPPIRLFDDAEKFVKINYTTWLNKIITEGLDMFAKGEFTYDEL